MSDFGRYVMDKFEHMEEGQRIRVDLYQFNKAFRPL